MNSSSHSTEFNIKKAIGTMHLNGIGTCRHLAPSASPPPGKMAGFPHQHFRSLGGPASNTCRSRPWDSLLDPGGVYRAVSRSILKYCLGSPVSPRFSVLSGAR